MALPWRDSRRRGLVRVVKVLAMKGGDSFQLREPIQRFEPFFAPVAGFPDATKGQFDTAACAVVVDEHLTGSQSFGHPHLARAVAGPDAGDKAVIGAVGDL